MREGRLERANLCCVDAKSLSVSYWNWWITTQTSEKGWIGVTAPQIIVRAAKSPDCITWRFPWHLRVYRDPFYCTHLQFQIPQVTQKRFQVHFSPQFTKRHSWHSKKVLLRFTVLCHFALMRKYLSLFWVSVIIDWRVKKKCPFRSQFCTLVSKIR